MGKSELIKLYVTKKLSVKQIADNKACSTAKVVYWMRKFNIPVRSRSEALYVRNNPNGDPFSVKPLVSDMDYFIMGMGLGLWWGEGNKMDKHAIRLGNSDPKLVKVFIKFLIERLGVDKSKIRLGLQVFGDQDVVLLKSKWLKELALSDESFFPSVVITKKRGKGTYKKLSNWGVLTVYFSNIKLRKILQSKFDEYVSRLL